MISLNDRFKTVDQMLDEGAFARLLDRANQILEGAPQSSASRVASNVSHKIADYELLNVIGQGGMGTVWKARQEQPIRRELAIKVIHCQLESSAEATSRFNIERQALARMDHPNIASIVDAGTTSNGQPYFAMEFFEGIGLCQFCDEHRLSIDDRIELFGDVCLAIQHAHQKGIVHRDLKPSNVLVKVIDGKPFAKVIDFGLAKMNEDSTDGNDADNTAFGQVLGSVRYMSPEQAGMRSQYVDTRSDVYSLGIILYELLCGQTPIRKEAVNDQTFVEIMQAIKEIDPAPPSQRLQVDSNEIEKACDHRDSTVSALSNKLKEDLDWIVMKSIAKEPEIRYQSAAELRNELLRFSNNQPVEARPASFSYQLKKFLAKHRWPVAAASLLFASLALGAIGTGIGWSRALNAEKLATDRFREANTARVAEVLAKTSALELAEKEREANQRAQELSDQTGEYNEILRGIFNDLNPRNSTQPLEQRLANKLHKAGIKIGENQYSGAKYQVKLLLDLGRSLDALGHPDQAVDLLQIAERVIRENAPDTQASWIAGVSYEIAKVYLGDEMPDKAVPLIELAIQNMEAIDGEHSSLLSLRHGLANAKAKLGDFQGAIQILEKLIPQRREVHGPEHKGTLTSMNILAYAYDNNGQKEKAVQQYEQVYQLRRKTLGKDAVGTIITLSNLASVLESMGDAEIALKKQTLAMQLFEKRLGRNHPNTLAVMVKTAQSNLKAGHLEDARELLEIVIPRMRKKLGDSHPRTIIAVTLMASVEQKGDNLPKALKILRDTLNQAQTELGADHRQSIAVSVALANALVQAEKFDAGIEQGQQALVNAVKKYGQGHFATRPASIALSRALAKTEQPQRVIAELEKVMSTENGFVGDQTERLGLIELATAYRVTGQLETAKSILTKLTDFWAPKLPAEHLDLKRIAKELKLSQQQ